MSLDYEQVRRRYADFAGRATAVYGLSPLLGRLYGTLLLTPRPMSLEDLTDAVGAAKSTVSVAIRNLKRYRLVRREWVRGDRRDFYVACTDYAAMLQDWYQLFFRHEIHYLEEGNAEVRKALRDARDALGGLTADERATILTRLAEVDRLISLFQVWFDGLRHVVGEQEIVPAEPIPIEVER
jgi:DNA-binding transcriptional regulator GbsR (MarR family)